MTSPSAATIARSAVGVTSVLFAGKFVSFLREVFIAKQFGASVHSDAISIAYTIPETIHSFFSAALVAIMIPVFVGAIERNEDVSRLVGVVANRSFCLLMALGVAGFAGIQLWVKLLAPKFSAEAHGLTAQLGRVTSLAIVSMGMFHLGMAVCNAFRRFLIPQVLLLAANLTVITVGVLMYDTWGPHAWAWGLVVGYGVWFVVLWIVIDRTMAPLRLIWTTQSAALKGIMATAGAFTLCTMLANLTSILARAFTSEYPEGSVFSIVLSFKVANFFYDPVFNALCIVLLPAFAVLYARGEIEKLRDSAHGAVRLCLLLFLPLAAGIVALHRPIIIAAFERGAFGAADTSQTAACLAVVSLGLPFNALCWMMSYICFGMNDVRHRNWALALILVSFAGSYLIGFRRLGLLGVAAAHAFSLFAAAVFSVFYLRRSAARVRFGPIIVPGLLYLAAAIVQAVVVWKFCVIHSLAFEKMSPAFIGHTLLAVALGMSCYLAILAVVRRRDVRQAWSLCRCWIQRKPARA